MTLLRRAGVSGAIPICLLFSHCLLLGQRVSFDPGKFYAAPGSTAGIAVCDFNRDGKPDVVVGRSNLLSAGYSLFLGASRGTFVRSADVSVENGIPEVIACGDINNDGKADVVLGYQYDLNNHASRLAVFLGNGDGTFQPPVEYAAGNILHSLQLADVNGDGKLDVIVVQDGTNGLTDVKVWLADALGGLATAFQSAPLSLVPTSIVADTFVVADVNHDGHPDLIIPFENGVYTFLGNGHGIFSNPIVTSTPFWTGGIATGDIDGDGILDIAVSSATSNEIALYLGNQDGTFHFSKSVTPGFWSGGAALGPLRMADFDGDGNLDLVFSFRDIVPYTVYGNVGVMLGNGHGNFSDSLNFSAEPGPIAVADLRGIGARDLLIGGLGGFVTFLQNHLNVVPAPSLQSIVLSSPQYPNDVVVADFNGDGIPDYAISGKVNLQFQVFVYLGNGDGTFHQASSFGPSSFSAFAAGDLNGDGKIDIAISDSNSISVYLGNGDGTFRAVPVLNLQTPPSWESLVNPGIKIGDINGDGKPDLVILTPNLDVPYTTKVAILLGNGDGTFRSFGKISFNATPTGVLLVDANNDGKLDVVTPTASGGLSVSIGNGDGTFQPTVFATRGSACCAGVRMTAVDLNNDGKVDLVAATPSSIIVSLGNGDGTFQSPLNFAAGLQVLDVAVADINGDGKLDIVATSEPGTLSILLGNGDGTFQPATNFPTGDYPATLAVADFNRDSKPDILVTNLNTSNANLFVNTPPPPPPSVQPPQLNPVASPPSIVFLFWQGTNPSTVTKSLTINSGFSSPFTMTASTPWITFAQQAGTAPSTVNVNFNLAALVPGAYGGTITVSFADGEALSIPVSVTVFAAPPVLSATPVPVSLTAITGSTTAQSQDVKLQSQNGSVSIQLTIQSGTQWLSATATQYTPGILHITANPAGLAQGTYLGSINVIAGGASNSPLSIPVTLTVTAPPAPTITAVINGASFVPGVIAANLIVTVKGTNFSCQNGGELLFDNVAGEILWSSDEQVNAIVPAEIAGRSSSGIQYVCAGNDSAAFYATIQGMAPGIFTFAGNGIGQASALNQDLSVNRITAPALRDSVVAVYITGCGTLSPAGADGLMRCVAPVSASVDGIPATVEYAGSAPGLTIGVQQVNVHIPATVPANPAAALQLTVGGISTQNSVTIAIH